MTSTSTPASAPLAGDQALVRGIGLWPATMLVVGNVIGSGIFLTTGNMVMELPSVTLVLAAWLAGGLIACAGGLALGEMGTMFPRSGGLYVYLEEAFGSVVGYLYGWALLMVILPGSVAAVAVGFAEYFSHFFPALGTAHAVAQLPMPWGTWTISAGQVVAAISIMFAGLVNIFGVGGASRIAAVVTVLKLAALAAIPLAALAMAPHVPALTPVVPAVPSPLAAFGVVMIAVMWAYDGWYYLAFAAAEVKDPSRTLPRAFIYGPLIVASTYLVVNLGYFVTLPLDAIKGEVRIAEKVGQALFGSAGASAIAAVVCLSTLGCNLAALLTSSRVGFAVANKGLFFKFATKVHPVYRTPHGALIGLTVFSCVLTLFGNYEQLFTYVTFGVVLFNTLGVAAIFRLRRTRPDIERPYRAWGYPVVPALFVLASLGLVANTLLQRPTESLVGLLLIAAGLPAYAYWRRRSPAQGQLP